MALKASAATSQKVTPPHSMVKAHPSPFARAGEIDSASWWQEQLCDIEIKSMDGEGGCICVLSLFQFTFSW